MSAEDYPFGPADGLSPHPRYASLRAEPGLARIRMPYGGDAWLATRVRRRAAGPRGSTGSPGPPLTEPGRWQRLVDRPALIPGAVEELLRYTPMAVSADFARIATADVELGGQTVRAGDAVLVQLHSADRDAAVFQDPDEIDLTRSPNPHVAFGHGVHHCLGAPLARMELQVILGGLVTGLPGLRLAGDVEWVADRLVRGVRGLPVAW